MISFGTDGVRHHTSARRRRIYMDRAMPEPIARALVGGVVLSLSPGRFVLVHSVWLNVGRSWGMMAAVVLQPASQKRPDSELRTANSVKALSLVCALLPLLVSLYSKYVLLRRSTRRIFRSGCGRSSTSHLKAGMRGGVRQAYADTWFLKIEMIWPQRKIRREKSGLKVGG